MMIFIINTKCVHSFYFIYIIFFFIKNIIYMIIMKDLNRLYSHFIVKYRIVETKALLFLKCLII